MNKKNVQAMRVLLSLAMTLILSSCTTTQKLDCNALDLQAKGLSLGQLGGKLDQEEVVFLKCPAANTAHNRTTLLDAYKSGLKSFCSADNGYSQAQAGEPLLDECDQYINSDYSTGFARGIVEYCQFAKGYESGVRGKKHNHHCQQSQFQEYAVGYIKGLEIYRATVEVRKLESLRLSTTRSMESHMRSLRNLESRITSTKNK